MEFSMAAYQMIMLFIFAHSVPEIPWPAMDGLQIIP